MYFSGFSMAILKRGHNKKFKPSAGPSPTLPHSTTPYLALRIAHDKHVTSKNSSDNMNALQILLKIPNNLLIVHTGLFILYFLYTYVSPYVALYIHYCLKC